MADFILKDGDLANFIPVFGAAIVVVQPGKLAGSGASTINGKNICIDGDEKKVSVPGCAYISGPHSIPGVGTLKISALAANQKAKKTYSAGKLVLLKGAMFTAEFEVQAPALNPSVAPAPPQPDAMKKYTGQGMFVTTNVKVTGT